MPELDSVDARNTIRKLIKNAVPIERAMPELIEYCAKHAPGPIWDQVAALDYASDWQQLKKWLTSVLSSEPPPPTIKALWFGLFLPVDRSGRVAIGLYVGGSKRFDRKDDTFDWASSPEYFPEGRYADSQVLRDVYDLSQQDVSLCSALHEIIGLGFAAISVAQICRQQPESIRGGAKKRHLATGFDAGEGLLIGSVTADGFEPTVHREINHLKPLRRTRSKAEFYIFKDPMPWEWVVNDIENIHSASHHLFKGERQTILDGWETEPVPRERRPPVDVLYPVIGPPIIHERIAKRIGELAGDAVQFIPVTVRGVSSNTRKYTIFHVLKEVACLDQDASSIWKPSVGSPWIRKAVIRQSMASGQHVFRLAESRYEIIISRQVKEILEGERVSGVKLIPLETTQ